MSSNELGLLAVLSSRKEYDKCRRYVKDYTVLKETHILVEDIGEWFKQHPSEDMIDWANFKTWFRVVKHPVWKLTQYEIYDTILDNVVKQVVDTSVVTRFKELDIAARIKHEADKIIQGAQGLGELRAVADELDTGSSSELSEFFIDMDINRLVNTVLTGSGIEWRLDELNVSVGQLHKSDFILIGKRPEVGGTTFLISEFTYMVKQLPQGTNAIIFNNEEGGDKLAIRLIQGALGITTSDILADPQQAIDDYNTYLGGRKITIMHKVDLSMHDIREVLAGGTYWLIGINVLEKVRAHNKEDDVTRRQRLAQDCRGLADKYGAVFAVSQAGDQAEGHKFLNQSQLYGSRTGVQGEIDVMIMIGQSNDPGQRDIRGISICKNKKPTTGRMMPTHKHMKFECTIDPERQRFRSL
jgi:hypothetical protein